MFCHSSLWQTFFYKILHMYKEDDGENANTAYLFHLSMQALMFPITCSSVCIQVSFHPGDWKKLC